MRHFVLVLALLVTACRPAPAAGRATLLGVASVPPKSSPAGMTLNLWRGTPAGRGMGLPIDLSYDRAPDLTLLPPALGRELHSPGAPPLTLDGTGAFRFPDLKPGTYHLEFKAAGASVGSRIKEVWVVVPGLELSADETVDLGKLVVVRPLQR
jgi:hypothetical protein